MTRPPMHGAELVRYLAARYVPTGAQVHWSWHETADADTYRVDAYRELPSGQWREAHGRVSEQALRRYLTTGAKSPFLDHVDDLVRDLTRMLFREGPIGRWRKFGRRTR